MDLEAVAARRPKVVIVDEIAHTNVRNENRKRYQDALELAEAGINVICAFNIQHLESLNDIVQRATGVVVRETVPDSFLKAADQVVTLDFAVEDLLERLRAGKIYGEEKVAKALEEFFKTENLSVFVNSPCGRWRRASIARRRPRRTKRSIARRLRGG